MAADGHHDLETQIGQWRSFLRERRAVTGADVEELESHLRDQVATLGAAGLDDDEAFLVAVKRMGSLDALSREFAKEHSDRLWKQLVLAPDSSAGSPRARGIEFLVALALAVAAAAAKKLPVLFGYDLDNAEEFYGRNLSLFVFPFLAGYFAWKRGLSSLGIGVLAAAFVAAAVLANLYPFQPEGSTEVLAAMHLPLALWLVVGFAYVGGQWRSGGRRMDFIRFSGELFIYYALIALGGGVLTGFTLNMFHVLGLDLEWLAESWIIPCGAMGAVLIGSWLVEAKQSVIENMAPVLSRVFTPLFAIVLVAFLSTMLLTGRGIDVEREVLIGFDLLLVLVLGLLLYSISARDPYAPPTWFDALQLGLVVGALVIDLFALAAIASRISEFGFSPNRTAALGENLILLVNLSWSAWLYLRFLLKRGSFAALERWQTDYLPVFGLWALIVVALFPPLFGFA